MFAYCREVDEFAIEPFHDCYLSATLSHVVFSEVEQYNLHQRRGKMIFKSYEEVVSEYHLEQIVNNIKNGIINVSGSDDIKSLVNDRNCKVDIISKTTSLNKSKGSMLIEAACVIHNEITVPKNINKIILVIDVALSNLSTNYVEVYEYESNKTKYETIILARNKFF
ncbi:hypothetical protein AB0559_000722 [Vibrio parahaemolyticus]|nr:hypothetical protein [Vibrio parahaemolyticus]MBE4184608.1 hypothetical protein [Vibrio parahaemolyticus]TOJ32888.1 hypothetical protein CGI41_10115 [Vibrio parahaemolyticus]TOJ81421.1 hypothetical protein CGI31_12085 [Vibrio parahaemolyticus]TOJ93785.1 hypothetical protein CGI29_16880 [Vibrio parahaemolyticus]